MAENKETGAQGKFSTQRAKTKDNLRNVSQELRDQLVSYDKMESAVNKIFKVEEMSLAAAKSANKINNSSTKEKVKSGMLDAEALDLANELVRNVKQRLESSKKLIAGARLLNIVAKSNPYIALAAVIIGIVYSFNALNKAASKTAKEFGTSRTEAAAIEAKLKLAAVNLIGLKITAEEARDSFNAIRRDLGGIDAATTSMVRNIADTANQLGIEQASFTKILSLQESISDMSREELINNAKLTKEIIRQAGVLPGDIYKDIAENTKLFAEYGKDGGGNIMAASVAARKLGLNLSTVAGISESLLNFEDSIQKQLEASLLLGREINTDKARELAFLGKQDELLAEIKKQAGGESEFNQMNVAQRRALGSALGVDPEELARLVRTQGQGQNAQNSQQMAANSKSELEALNRIAAATEGSKEAQSGFNQKFKTAFGFE
tara:strand:- start:299 stop:1606 length:1308 start_codon:yes stop_codon:yes gene_type:complete